MIQTPCASKLRCSCLPNLHLPSPCHCQVCPSFPTTTEAAHRCPHIMRCGSRCAVRMGQSCRTCDGGRIGSAGRVGLQGRGTLQRGNGRVCDRRCCRPTTAAAVAAPRTRWSMSGGWDDHDRGASVQACLEPLGCPNRHGMRVGSGYSPKGQHTREAAPQTKAPTYLSL